jgi:hypothetical protein
MICRDFPAAPEADLGDRGRAFPRAAKPVGGTSMLQINASRELSWEQSWNGGDYGAICG